MSYVRAVIFCFVISGSWTLENLVFPPGFKFGVSTAAYQIEGAWNVSDKSESIWDRLLHTQVNLTADGDNGDVACDSYHLWRRDIEMLEELGVNMYRFSISWPRLLPSGFPNIISEDGKRYYNDLIDGLLKKGIEPVVTMYHWDLPQSLQDLGGWANPLVSDWFADYARVLFTLYGDRVKTWLTINEPIAICDGAYSQFFAPYLNETKIGIYLCNKYVLIAHAKAYRLYDEEFRHLYHGKLSITNIIDWFEPESPKDTDATELMFQMFEGRFGHAIYSKRGGWPPQLEKVLNEKSKREGYPYPRLLPFTQEETDFVRGTHDFYAINHYFTRLVRKEKPGFKPDGPSLFFGFEEIEAAMVSSPSFKTAVADWWMLYPEGFRKLLHWVNSTYGVNEIMIMETGLPSFKKDLYDYNRLLNIKSYLEQVRDLEIPIALKAATDNTGINTDEVTLLAINDGIPITGYAVWSLMDTFEWMSSYTINFGLYSVNFTSPQRTRTPRESARYYSSVARTKSINPSRHGLDLI